MFKYFILVIQLLYVGAYMLRDESDVGEGTALSIINILVWASTIKLGIVLWP